MKDPNIKAAAQRLEVQLGVPVGSGYGFPNSLNGEPESFLIVWSDTSVKFPSKFEGYTVVRRGVPVAY